MLARQHGKESSMDNQRSSILKPMSEVHLDVSLEGTTTDKASQDYCGPTEEVHIEVSSEGTTDRDSQDDREPTEGMPKAVINEKYRSLFEATLKGDWKVVENILNKDPEAMTAEVMTIEDETVNVLEVAIMAVQDQLVENLVKYFPPKCKDSIPSRAFYVAAPRGRIRMVKALVDKVDDQPENVDLALWYAISNAPMQKEVIWYLARHTSSTPNYATMSSLIMASHLDICLYLAHRYPGSASMVDSINDSILGDLAKMESNFRSGTRLNFWENLIDKCIPLYLINTSFDNSKDTKMTKGAAVLIKMIGQSKLRHKCSLEFANLALTEMKTRMKILEILKLISGIVLDAASRGISEIVQLCLEHFPELTWDYNFTEKLIKEVVNGRHVELFRLVEAHKYLTNNRKTKHGLMEAIVEWSPRCVPANVSGAAFLMQRELQWFKVLEERSDSSFRSLKFKASRVRIGPHLKSLKLLKNRKTYWDIFVEKRQDLVKEAGQWMKDTSSSCSVVATLIITIAFTAAFTVPGGNDSNTGIPIFLKKSSFMVFAIADALALFSSVTATLMFLAILTSRYVAEDFLHSLSRKMILGLTFLFLSLAFMMVAFGSALTIVLNEQLKWIYIPITLLAAFPVVLFAILQLPLYVEIVESTYWPRLYRPVKIWK